VPAEPLTPEQLQRRHRLSVTWAVLVVGWSLLRAAVVWAGLSQYGVNPWAYLAIDLASAGVDAFTTPRFVLGLIDGRYSEAAKWGALSLFAFVIPDLYIFATTRELPGMVVAVILVVISITLAVAVIGVVKKVRAGRTGRDDSTPVEVTSA
jgi:hypothetical protein